ncbi:putative 26S proteasome subunit RPN7-domain-containing protein [Seiridium cardinale]|uniref:26S proteasome subunit RPN7-domain-containing protein n=1 Tax=Seiridium unicorne TaxID=138068 RepID=A0ABR2UR07_9PEZI
MADQNSNQLLAFFTAMDNQGNVIVKDAPKLDLDLYISNYKGRTRFDRLLLIGQSSVPLCVDALKAAIVEAKKGKDTQRYRNAWEAIRIAAPNEPEAQWDQAWLDKTEQSNKTETHRLDIELKQYKNNLVRESIRIGYRDIGLHQESIGDLQAAQDAFLRMRGEASTQSHLLEVARHLISAMVQRRDWPSVLANVNKMLSGSLSENDLKAQQPYQKVVTGIANLHSEKYYEAAKNFLETGDLPACQLLNDVISPNDVATYGGLLALASMDRAELQSRVLNNTSFRSYLELESHIRKAINMFVNGRYSQCLAILESYRPDYLLDIHLQAHVPAIYSQIRTKCIVQYFIPFSCVTLDSMNEAFAKPGESLEAELVTMIRSGKLLARINTIDRLLVAVSSDRRVEMQVKALEAAKNYEKEALERIRRMSIIAADLEVKGGGRKGNGPGGSGISEVWYEETRKGIAESSF